MIVIAQTEDSAVIAGNGEAYSISLPRGSDLETFKHRIQFGKQVIPDVDEKHYDPKYPKQTYEESAMRMVRISRQATSQELSYSAADQQVKDPMEMIEKMIGNYRTSPVASGLKYQEYAQKNDFMIKSLDKSMKVKFHKEAPAMLEKLEKDLKGLDVKAQENGWSYNKLLQERTNKKNEIESLKSKMTQAGIHK